MDARIEKGEFGPPCIERLELLVALHQQIEGAPIQAVSKQLLFDSLQQFIRWVDLQGSASPLELATARSLFLAWADHLQCRVQINKNLNRLTAYSYVKNVAASLGPVTDPNSALASEALLRSTPIRRPKQLRRSRGQKLEKQRLDELYSFGHFLSDLCSGLTVDAAPRVRIVAALIDH